MHVRNHFSVLTMSLLVSRARSCIRYKPLIYLVPAGGFEPPTY
jgi:hypothetical protein